MGIEVCVEELKYVVYVCLQMMPMYLWLDSVKKIGKGPPNTNPPRPNTQQIRLTMFYTHVKINIKNSKK
jgi:hypothetical protein